MAITYASVGDTIRVMYEGKTYEFRVSVLPPTYVGRDEPPVGFNPEMNMGEIVTALGGREVVMCEACGENEAGDYETGTGRHICPACVNSALVYRAAMYVMEHIDQYDPELGTIITLLNEDDAAMRASQRPYVDSHSAGMDMMSGSGARERFEYLRPLFETIVGALGEPGDMQGAEITLRN